MARYLKPQIILLDIKKQLTHMIKKIQTSKDRNS